MRKCPHFFCADCVFFKEGVEFVDAYLGVTHFAVVSLKNKGKPESVSMQISCRVRARFFNASLLEWVPNS